VVLIEAYRIQGRFNPNGALMSKTGLLDTDRQQ
jgi:hypothetical protein